MSFRQLKCCRASVCSIPTKRPQFAIAVFDTQLSRNWRKPASGRFTRRYGAALFYLLKKTSKSYSCTTATRSVRAIYTQMVNIRHQPPLVSVQELIVAMIQIGLVLNSLLKECKDRYDVCVTLVAQCVTKAQFGKAGQCKPGIARLEH